MSSIAILAAWSVGEQGGDIYLSSTHFVYLEYITTHYDKVYLLSTRSMGNTIENRTLFKADHLEFIPLPSISSHLNAMSKCGVWKAAIKSVADKVDVVYCRTPDPFSWMPALLFKKKTIMHFVGDTIDAAKNNEKWSWLKKQLMILGFLPEYMMTLLAARRSRVYTNGYHLAKKLSKYGIKASPVISSTVRATSLKDPDAPTFHQKLRLIYIGYIRFAKGIKTIMKLCSMLQIKGIDYQFDIVGSGEFFDELREYVTENGLSNNVILHGHINDRDKMNQMLRGSDLFIFPSLSEGSPRVTIEAMAQGVPVVSTPVGSLPTTFQDGDTIRYFDFHDATKAFEIIQEYLSDPRPFIAQRDKAFNEIKEKYTIEAFLNQVFSY